MLVLRFGNEALWRDCCDATHMRHRWGPERARRLSRRLQQLEAMTSLEDLAFMPFNSLERADGGIEIAVDKDTSLLVQGADRSQEDQAMQVTVIVTAVDARSIAVP